MRIWTTFGCFNDRSVLNPPPRLWNTEPTKEKLHCHCQDWTTKARRNRLTISFVLFFFSYSRHHSEQFGFETNDDKYNLSFLYLVLISNSPALIFYWSKLCQRKGPLATCLNAELIKIMTCGWNDQRKVEADPWVEGGRILSAGWNRVNLSAVWPVSRRGCCVRWGTFLRWVGRDMQGQTDEAMKWVVVVVVWGGVSLFNFSHVCKIFLVC